MGNGFSCVSVSGEATSADRDWPPGTNGLHCQYLRDLEAEVLQKRWWVFLSQWGRCIWGGFKKVKYKLFISPSNSK